MKSVACAVALSSLVLASPASAEIIDERPSNEGDHNSGFLFRGTLGVGYQALTVSQEVLGTDFETSVSGLGASLGVALGGFVIPNLAINADLYGSTIIDPTLEAEGQEVDVDASITYAAIGVGVTYYIMPLNLYVAGSLGFGRMTFEQNGEEFESEIGFSVHAAVGKEWFVNSDWGLGVAAELTWADVPTEVDDASASYLGFNVAFSFTYN